MTNEPAVLCPEEKMSMLIAHVDDDEAYGMIQLESLLRAYPGDPRLHFLKGSLLAGQQDYEGAQCAMRQAVDLAPDYLIARFQLGFLLLTCGEPHKAQEAWGPLHGLPADNYLHLFVKGLCHLIGDEFDDARSTLQEGIARNDDNPAMNGDIRLIIDEIGRKQISPGEEAPLSSAQLLLQQAALKATRH